MAFIPNTFVLPGVYGPTSYPVKKIEDGYYIRGYGAEFKGSFRDIAKQIVLKLTKEPETFEARKNYVGPFHIKLKPEIECIFCMHADPEPKDLDIKVLAEKISKELQSLSKLIPFS